MKTICLLLYILSGLFTISLDQGTACQLPLLNIRLLDTLPQEMLPTNYLLALGTQKDEGIRNGSSKVKEPETLKASEPKLVCHIPKKSAKKSVTTPPQKRMVPLYSSELPS